MIGGIRTLTVLQRGAAMLRENLTQRQKELIEEVKAIAEQLGYVPTLQMMNDEPGWPNIGTVHYHFNSYTDLLKLAGLPVKRCTRRYSTNELMAMLRSYILHLGRIPNQTEVRANPNLPSDETFLNLYPSWEELINALGFTMNWCTPEYRERLLAELRQKYIKLGYELPRPQDIQNDPKMEKVNVYVQIFGDLNYAYTAAGIRDDYYSRQRKEIADTIRSIYKETGRVPRVKDPGIPNDKFIRKVFGSYSEALKYAGIRPNHERYTKKKLVQQLRQKCAQIGYTPTMREINDDPNMASAQTYRRFFKSYDGALKAARLKPSRGRA